MKYSVGQKVKIRSLKWYRDNVNRYGIIECGKYGFFEPMNEYCGKVVTIKRIYDDSYRIDADKGAFCWTDEMIEGLVEDEALKQYEVPTGSIKIWDLPIGYVFKDERGNVINATKIILEKKKKEYPKTYGECCKVLGFLNIKLCFDADYRSLDDSKRQWEKLVLINRFYQLLICRDAYWKIAGDEMGLGKPWKPDWNDGEWKWCISYSCNCVEFDQYKSKHHTLAFPTKEMRDAFKENFDKDLEFCKELL